LQKGRVVETGTHESLLENEAGVYAGLVRAQQLSLGEPTVDSDDEVHEEEDMGAILSREKSAAKSETDSTVKKAAGKQKGFLGSIVKLMLEQKSRWPWYISTIIAAAGCGSAVPLVAFLFAKVIDIFKYAGDPDKMRSVSSFDGLMWTVLAICVAVAYFFMGATSTHTSHHVSAAYRKSYFEDILFQKTLFFDQDENSQGSLTARVSGDPKQIEEMMGLNMGMVYTA
jgi:ABC-type multidrug transport system fused ATPase/permease subunit